MLIAGYDDEPAGPSLYFMDYLSALVKVPFAIHGYGSYFGLSICDKYYKKDMNETEALALLNKIIAEVIWIKFFVFFLKNFKLFLFLKIQKRFMANLPSWQVRVISSKGIKDLPTIYNKAGGPAVGQTESMEM